MTQIVFVTADGTDYPVDAQDGESIMSAAVRNQVPGLLGECGGSLACATCHVYMPEDGTDNVPELSDFENEMLEMTVSERLPTSRLSCQISIAPQFDGMRITLPPEQL